MASWSKASFASSTPLHDRTTSESGAGLSLVNLFMSCMICGVSGLLKQPPSLSARSSSIFTDEGCQLVRPRGVRSRIDSQPGADRLNVVSGSAPLDQKALAIMAGRRSSVSSAPGGGPAPSRKAGSRRGHRPFHSAQQAALGPATRPRARGR